MSNTTLWTRFTQDLLTPWVILLAATATPRVVLHDLKIIREGEFINSLFVFVPVVIWYIVIFLKRPESSFPVFAAIGVWYGIGLGVIHNIMWGQVFTNGTPRLGGNLEGSFPYWIEELLMRTAILISGLFTGIVFALVAGLVFLALSYPVKRFRNKTQNESEHKTL